jgi:hypothetical protein
MWGVLFLIFGIGRFGWCDYVTVNTGAGGPTTPRGTTTKVCVAVKVLHICLIPLFPLYAELVISPSSSLLACRGNAHTAAFKGCSWGTAYFWRAYMWAWLRFLSFGLLACCEPSCSDPEALMAALLVAPGSGGGGNGVTQDNRSSYGTSAGAAPVIEDNKTREQQSAATAEGAYHAA